MANNPVPFTRATVPDPQTNNVIQDLYNKLAQVSASLSTIQTRLDKIEARLPPP